MLHLVQVQSESRLRAAKWGTMIATRRETLVRE